MVLDITTFKNFKEIFSEYNEIDSTMLYVDGGTWLSIDYKGYGVAVTSVYMTLGNDWMFLAMTILSDGGRSPVIGLGSSDVTIRHARTKYYDYPFQVIELLKHVMLQSNGYNSDLPTRTPLGFEKKYPIDYLITIVPT